MAKAKKQKALKADAVITPKKAHGRPSLFTDQLAERVLEMAKAGATDKQIAAAINVSAQTIGYWKTNNEGFLESLKSYKTVADSFVEATLFQRACGVSVPETKVFYDSERGQVVEHTVMKHYPPDTTAMIFWLKNRQPERWRDQPEQRNETELPQPIYDVIESQPNKTPK